MTHQPKPPMNEPVIRLVMMPRDTNSQGTIFGGVILSLMDQAAYVEALRQGPHRYVTVAFRAVEFHKPVLVGDVLSLYGETRSIGRTSITIHIRVYASRRSNPEEKVEVTEGEIVFVAVDEEGEPISVISD